MAGDPAVANRHNVSFPVDPFREDLLDLVKNVEEPAKWPAVNSIKHLNRAWKLADLDPMMAAFRAITAEEEAATSIFWSLQRLRYQGADELKHTNHVHKQALIPFLDAARTLISATSKIVERFSFRINSALVPRTVELVLQYRPPLFQGYVTSPQPPLHFSIFFNEREPDLKDQLASIASRAGVASMSHVLRRRASTRNQLLYANRDGINELGSPVQGLLVQKSGDVFRLITLLLLIDPHPREQLFVSQMLEIFLKMLKQVPKDLKFA